MTEDKCFRCRQHLGTPEEHREAGAQPGNPFMCSRCAHLMVIGDNLELEDLSDEENEKILEAQPILKQMRADVLSTEFTDGSSCPGCKREIESSTPIGLGIRPIPRALSACGSCGALAIYTFDMRLRLMTEEEAENAKQSPNLPPEVRAILLAHNKMDVDATLCPSCNSVLDKVSNADMSTPSRAPNPGDLSICDNCAALLIFVEGGGVRLATDEECEAIIKKMPEVGRYIAQAMSQGQIKYEA